MSQSGVCVTSRASRVRFWRALSMLESKALIETLR
jgi:hypothetical protein